MSINQLLKGNPDVIHGNGALTNEIERAEKRLEILFSKDYKNYLFEFGSVVINDHELTGISKTKHRDVVSVTLDKWDFHEDFKRRRLYVIEDIGIDDIIIWQDGKGNIYESQGNAIKKIYDTFEDYIKYIINE